MKKTLFKLFALALVLTLANACNDALVTDDVDESIELKSASSAQKSYIVVLQDSDLESELATLKGYEKKQVAVKSASEKILKRAGISDSEITFTYGTAVKGFAVKMAPGQMKKLENDPSVKYIDEDQVITLVQPDIKIKTKPAPVPTAQTTPWGIARVNGGITYTGSNKIWIIDTGIDLDHPDLNVDLVNGWNFVAGTQVADDDNGHGSHCAGIAAAKDNSEGVIGVAAGATVVPVKVLNKRGSGSYSAIIAGVDWVADHAAVGDVANMSLGGGYDATLNSAVETAASLKINFSLAAGNESTDANTKSPASANGTYIYTISASDINDNWAYFSNYGNPPVDFCEPGYSIYSTYKGGSYTTMSGTSMAAPHAAGLLLLGSINNGGTVNGDPDGNPDIIGVH
ncbi:S8 family serine peptidase [Maribellus sp. YY47]|uniref:S8 family serine peptidase n=1 Tax=Maribellus sp. YY47 TaxID=2929486 RepID=UPI0020007A87|nr:S8 family serine peptidase [Maribellus sp. YY47]MCK3685479.1 S8 family serine peptidase [Maribellus sp. YY47]